MSSFLNTRVTYVWVFLAGLTAASWIIADGYDPKHTETAMYVTIGLMLLAFFKIRLVIMHFMEIATAPIPLRILFEAWVIVVCAAIIILYLTGMSN